MRLYGSLPQKILNQLSIERNLKKEKLLQKNLSLQETNEQLKKINSLYFGKFDDLLDRGKTGPHWLGQDNIATCIINALLFFDEKRYKVICYTIISNHIHFIFYKLDRELSSTMRNFKSYTAQEANKLLDNQGKPFWGIESYDHYCRNKVDLRNQILYCLNNPVKAGKVKNWKDWKYSYLREKFKSFTE